MGNQESYNDEKEVVVLREKIEQMTIAEARQEKLIDDLKSTLMALTRKGPDECVYSVKEIDRLKINIEELQDLYDTARADQGALAHEKKRLTADLAAMKEQLERLLNRVNAVTAFHRHGNSIPKQKLDDLANRQIEVEQVIAACETGGQNVKE